jgi:predicted acylesterase/phospholipase RssA
LSVESGIEVLGTRVHRVPNRYRVALVIVGGGSRGMFSAGMCLGLEEHRLESVFDAVYRASGRFIG